MFGGLFVNKGGTGTRVNKSLDIFPILEKTHVLRPGRLKRSHIATQSSALLRAQQRRPAQRGKRVEGKRPGSIEKA